MTALCVFCVSTRAELLGISVQPSNIQCCSSLEVLAKLCAAVSKELAAGHCLADFLAAGTGVGDDDGDLHERLYPLSPLQICARNGTRGRMPQKNTGQCSRQTLFTQSATRPAPSEARRWARARCVDFRMWYSARASEDSKKRDRGRSRPPLAPRARPPP